ncbi:hypothetical protein [Agromyces humatus]|uniref:DUF4386 family protein n=1 Tax=Agromyces humatus TaxID=279573 RepID=A0ABN2KUR9_9MICO|nr:hypothetical protein [Agromyces humatus]
MHQHRQARFHRLTTAVSLVLYAALAVVFVFTAPASSDDTVADLEIIAASGAGPTISAYAFLAAQAALVIGLIGVAHLLRDRTPVIAPIAVAISILGAFAHAAVAGFSLVEIGAASVGPSSIDGAAAAIDATITGVATPVSLVGLAGTVLGTILLAVAVFRSRLGAVWVGIVLIGWVVVEFVAGSLGMWATIMSGVLLMAGFIGLAFTVWRSRLRDWLTAREAEVVLERVTA